MTNGISENVAVLGWLTHLFDLKMALRSTFDITVNMMTSSNGSIFLVTGPLCGEFTGRRWIHLIKSSDAELWCFLWSTPWINGLIGNREAGDLRRHHAHYDVIVTKKLHLNYAHCTINRDALQSAMLDKFDRKGVIAANLINIMQ